MKIMSENKSHVQRKVSNSETRLGEKTNKAYTQAIKGGTYIHSSSVIKATENSSKIIQPHLHAY